MPSVSLRSTRQRAAAAAVVALATLALGLAAPPARAAQPVPGHTGLVPAVPRTNTPRISTGEIWDIEVVGQRVLVAGSFDTVNGVARRKIASISPATGAPVAGAYTVTPTVTDGWGRAAGASRPVAVAAT